MAVRIHRGSLRRSQDGATGVEYALLGAVVGLGILGSLFATKTSLNAAFSGIAGQVGSAMTGKAAQTVAEYWNAKGYARPTVQPNGYGNTYMFDYPDNSRVTITYQPGQAPPLQYKYMDYAANQVRQLQYNDSGQLIGYSLAQYAGTAFQYIQSSQSVTNNGSALIGNPPTGAGMSSVIFDAKGNYVKTVNSVDDVYYQAASKNVDEKAYFDGLVKAAQP